jgi:broad specificity phosphatase PhoE
MSEPAEIWLVRHGQSQGNVAREAPRAADQELLDIADRDMDVPLSALGAEQAASFGRWLATQPATPDVVIASPYVRAAQTAEGLCSAAGLTGRVHLDERLRERELGILDLLTWRGVQVRFPEEAKRRERLGKFYHRPPGGESWVDVALRLRSLRDSLAREHEGKRVMIVTHEVPILIMRYLLEDLTEQQVLAMGGTMPNCSLTRYVMDDEGHPHLDLVGWTAPLEAEGVAVTAAPETPVAPR